MLMKVMILRVAINQAWWTGKKIDVSTEMRGGILRSNAGSQSK